MKAVAVAGKCHCYIVAYDAGNCAPNADKLNKSKSFIMTKTSDSFNCVASKNTVSMCMSSFWVCLFSTHKKQ